MRLKYMSTLLQPQEKMVPIRSISTAPSMKKMAAVVEERTIVIFDEKGEQRDRFATKPVDAKYGKKSYSVLCIAFSPDSSSLAVGQTDNVVYVYKTGTDWNEKKVIVNKLVQTAATTALVWPFDDKLIIGLADGKARVGLLKQNKCASLYKTEMGVIALAVNPKRTSFVSAHLDGSIIIYSFATKSQSKLCSHPCAPYSLAFTSHTIVAAGADRRIMCYTENGIVQQTFDFASVDEREFAAMTTDPTGQNFVVGSFDRLRLFSWNAKRGSYEEGHPLEIEYLYTTTALAWKADGSTVYCGTLCGGIFVIDCCLTRKMLRSRFETTCVAPSHVLIRDMNSDQRMMGDDRYVVGYTSSTLIIAEIESSRFSEIDWTGGGNEKFYFENANVCMIVNVGEITIVEYGVDGAIGWVRTELTSPYLISVRLAERGVRGEEPAKKIAYLLDPSTIAIVNLATGQQEHSITHTNSIDWLELNETARKLLFRDRRQRVQLVDLTGPEPRQSNLLAFCTYCQWVPTSDVIVAQSGDTLYVWYNADHPEQMTTVSIKGEVEGVQRDVERTEVIVQESTAKVAYELDNTQIEFGFALENLDFERAVAFLERSSPETDTYSMWKQVGEMAIAHHKLIIAQRCFAAIGDVAKVQLLQTTVEMASEAAETLGGDGTQDSRVRANIAKLMKRFKEAENIYLEANDVEEAIRMYQTLHKWDDALELAKATNYPGYEQLKAAYYRALGDTGQDGKAAELKVAEGDKRAAVQLFLRANQPVQALRLLLNEDELLNDEGLAGNVAASLLKNRLFDRAGSLFEKLHDFPRALYSYRQGAAFAQAVALARFAFPERVVEIEEEWGDALVKEGKHDGAINHFLESNATVKAVEAAIRAKEYNKAVQIVDVIADPATAKNYYNDIAGYYADNGDYDRAERYYIEADSYQSAIEMYFRAAKWPEAYRLSAEFLGKEETTRLYEQKATEMEDNGLLHDAEQMYLAIGLTNRAIDMYRKNERNDDVVRLVEKFHGEKLGDVHKMLGMELEEKGELRAAEEAFLKAGDYAAASNMYAQRGQFSDAFRLAKAEGGAQSQKQIAYEWAKSLGGDAAVKLLNKHGMLHEVIVTACDKGHFDFAFELARLGAKDQLTEVHKKFGRHCEDEGRFDEASKHYVEGGFPEEAVEMFVHDQDWANAEIVAGQHAPTMLQKVFHEQAMRAMEQGDHQRGESFLLRANEPHLILKYYTHNQMWPDAIRIAKEYAPNQLEGLQAEYEHAELRSGARGVDSFVAQAREWEGQSEWLRAVTTYLKVAPDLTPNTALVSQCALKAADITIKFLLGRHDEALVEAVLGRLDEIGAHEKAAEMHLALNRPRDAILAFCRAKQWGKAKAIAQELIPQMEDEVDAAYKESLRNEGKLGELIDVDVIAAIDLLVERGQWDKALETARQQKHKPLLDKYVARYCSDLIQGGDINRAIETFNRFGVSANDANFNMYIAIFEDVISKPSDSPLEEYHRLSSARDLFLKVVEELQTAGTVDHIEMSRYLWASHFSAFHVALGAVEVSPEMSKLRLRQQLSLLRYTDILPADRCFFTAGAAARDYGNGYENVAFVLLNHFLDLAEAIDEDNPSMVDHADFEGTDIPTEIPLPKELAVSRADLEETKEWVLAMTVDEGAEKVLLEDRRGVFEASLVDRSGETAPMCMVSGYPILGHSVSLGNGLEANKEDLNRFILVLKSSPTDQLHDVHTFLSTAAKQPLSLFL